MPVFLGALGPLALGALRSALMWGGASAAAGTVKDWFTGKPAQPGLLSPVPYNPAPGAGYGAPAKGGLLDGSTVLLLGGAAAAGWWFFGRGHGARRSGGR